MSRPEGLSLEDCNDLVDSLWNDDAEDIFGTKTNMTMNVILMLMSSLLDINLMDDTVRNTISKDKNPTKLIADLFDL